MTVEELRENVEESNNAGHGCVPYPQCVEMIENTKEQAREYSGDQVVTGTTANTTSVPATTIPTMVENMQTSTMIVLAVVIIYHLAILLIVGGILGGINKLNKQVGKITLESDISQERRLQTPDVQGEGRA